MGQIFISYSHEDKNYVHEFWKALQDKGFDVWIDDRIDYGTTWPMVIQKKLDACSAFVIVMSENAYKSKWVHNEVTRAERKKKPFFVLLLSGDTWLSFEAIQYENVSDGSLPTEKFYERLKEFTWEKSEIVEDESTKEVTYGGTGQQTKGTVVAEKGKYEKVEVSTNAESNPPKKKETSKTSKYSDKLIIFAAIGLFVCIMCGVTVVVISYLQIPTSVPTATNAPISAPAYISFTPTQSKSPHSVTVTPSKSTSLSLTFTFTPPVLSTTSIPPTQTQTNVPQPNPDTLLSIVTSTPRPTRTPPTPRIIPSATDTPVSPTATSTLTETSTFTATSTPTTSLAQVAVIQSFLAPGPYAEGITWDGTNLWVTDNSATTFKVDPLGNVLDSFTAPEGTPQGITWDGSSLWIYTTSRNRIYQVQYNGVQTQIISNFNSPAEVVGGGITNDMAWDGNNLWFANQFKVYHLTTTGVQLSHFTFPKNVLGMDWDGTNLWLAYYNASGSMTLSKVDVTGKVLVSYPSPVPEIDGLAWANGYLWALYVNYVNSSSTIYQLAIP